jgi:hypothetical protein
MEEDFTALQRLVSEAIACAKAGKWRSAADSLRRLASLATTLAVTLEMRRGH